MKSIKMCYFPQWKSNVRYLNLMDIFHECGFMFPCLKRI